MHSARRLSRSCSTASPLPRILPRPRAPLARSYHPTPRLQRPAGLPVPASSSARRTASVTDDFPAPTPELRPAKEDPADEPSPPEDSLSNLDVYGHIPPPGSAVETVYADGFLFSSGVRFRDGSGALLIHNEAFKWRPAERGSRVEQEAVRKGILELGPEVWGLLDIVHPKPELLIVGTGYRTLMLSNADRGRIMEMGLRMDVMDTTHAASQYNLLATERPQGQIAAALLVDSFGSR